MNIVGFSVGLAIGAVAGLLAAPMRGTELRARLRLHAEEARGVGMSLLEDRRGPWASSTPPVASDAPVRLSATLGEIAEFHSSSEHSSTEARS